MGEKIDDPEDSKPEDWDKPQHIPDPDAKKPEDWDDDIDGEWEPPSIDNPEYKGEWKPKQIDNPDYTPDDKLYLYKDIRAVGVDVWQVKSGTIFDNFFIGDDFEEAKKFAEETWGVSKDGEKKMKDDIDAEEEDNEDEEEEEEEDESVKDEL